MSILSICQWLQESFLGRAVREGFYGYAIPQAAHMLGIALFGGAVIMDDLRLLGRLRRPAFSELSRQLIPLKWIGLIVTVVTGVLLFMSDATRFYANPAFVAKTILLVLVALNAWIFRSVVYRDVARWDTSPQPPAGAKLAACFSLLLWVGVIFASRAIAFSMKQE